MSYLIEELKADHCAILAMLDAVRTAGVTSAEGQQHLRQARKMLVEHLRTEDKRFYPALRRTAEQDPDLRQKLNTFARDMDEISHNALEFFERYTDGGNGLEFARDFGRLYATIWQRQQREESILYREYERRN